jgi:hypothetical protein
MDSAGQGPETHRISHAELAIGTVISSARTTRQDARDPPTCAGPGLCRAHQIRHADLVDLVKGVADGDGRSCRNERVPYTYALLCMVR